MMSDSTSRDADCRRTADRLAAYVDDALPANEQAEVDGHLAVCPPCRRAAVGERGARSVLRERAAKLKDGALKSTPLPLGLRSRCEALARAHAVSDSRSARWFAFRRLVPVSLTAVATLVVALAGFSLITHRSNTVLAAQLTADHAKCFRLFARDGASGVDAGRVEQMLEDDYGWDVHVPPSSAAEGVELIGARRCLYADGSIPHVMYRVNGHDVSLYMLEGVTRPSADVVSLGHRSKIWTRGATTYVLVWPVSAGDLTAAAQYVMSEAH